MDAGGAAEDRAARAAQVDQLLQAITSRSSGHAIIVAGDTNMGTNEAGLAKLLADAGLTDACRALSCGDERIDRIELHVRRMLRYMTPIVAFGFVLAVHLIDWAPIWRLRDTRRIQTLRGARAEELLMEMSASRLTLVRTMLLGIRGITLSTFYDQDETHRAMGFHPLPFVSDKIELRRRLLAAPARSVGGAAY